MKIWVLWGIVCFVLYVNFLVGDVYIDDYYQQYVIVIEYIDMLNKSWNWLVLGDWGCNGYFVQCSVV